MNPKEKVTIYDISKASGVSIATVSRVLNNASNVSDKTRAKIENVIRELGYEPNVFARGLGLDTMHTVGVLCADCSDPYLAKAVYYVEEELREKKYSSLLCCTGYSPEEKEKALNLLLSKKIDAVILIGSNFIASSESDNMYIRKAADSVPVMLLNASYDYPNVYSFFCDDFSAVKASVNFLFNKCKKKILYIYNSKSFSGQKKLDGYISAHNDNSVPIEDSRILFCPGGIDDIDKCVELLDNHCESGLIFDAVMASEDYLAIAAVKYAIKKGMRVPDDVAVIGYNNSSLAKASEPELTSIDNRLQAISNQLVKSLLEVLGGNTIPARTEYTGVLIERGTT